MSNSSIVCFNPLECEAYMSALVTFEHRTAKSTMQGMTSLLPSKFTGSQSQIDLIDSLDQKTKLEWIQSLQPAQRIHLSPRLIELYYQNVSVENITINSTYVKTIGQFFSPLPYINGPAKTKEIINIYDDLIANSSLLDSHIIRQSLSKIVLSLFPEDEIEGDSNGLDAEEEEIESDVNSEFGELGAQSSQNATFLDHLLRYFVVFLQDQQCEPKIKLQYLREIAGAGNLKESEQVIYLHQLYLKWMNCSNQQTKIAQVLHNFRYEIITRISASKNDELQATLEELYRIVELYGSDLGLLVYYVIAENEPINYEKFKDPKYLEKMIESWKYYKSQKEIDSELQEISEKSRERDRILKEFYSSYTPEKILELLRAQSSELELYKWFYGPLSLSYKDYSSYVIEHVLDNDSKRMKEHYLKLMLDILEIFTFKV